MTQRINPFWTWLSELNISFQADLKNWTFLNYDSKNCFFKNTTQSIDKKWLEPIFFILTTTLNFLKWLKFFNMTPRIELLKFHSKNWTFLFNMTHRIEPIFQMFDSKNWTLFAKIFKELNLFLSMTQRIEWIFPTWLKKLGMVHMEHLRACLKELNFFFEIKHDTKNWTCCEIKIDRENWTFLNQIFVFLQKNHRFEPFSTWLNELNWISKIWLKDLDPKRFVWLQQPNFFMTQGIEHFLNMMQRIEPLSVKHMDHKIAFFL